MFDMVSWFVRIRIQLPKNMRIIADPDQDPNPWNVKYDMII